MYISKIIIDGFRGFKHSEIEFQEGLNVIIGHNNGGKSTIMDALRLVLEYGSRKNLSAWDFCQKEELQTLKDNPPSVKLSVYIKEQKEEGMSDDVALFTNYAVQTSPLLESCLTYVYSLPQTEVEKYKKDVADVTDKYSLFKTIDDKYIRKYTHAIYGGPVVSQNQALGEDLKKIDFEFVNALRNVEDEIYGGRAALLRDVLRYFLDYDLNGDENREDKIALRHQNFINDTHEVLKNLVQRITAGKDNIIAYANKTGALFSDNILNLEGDVSEGDLLAVLNLLVGDGEDRRLPVALNGLGYNNLIYISLLLAKMQSNAKADFMGSSNVKAFSVLAIEEPEAHLHPQMQYQFLEFLRNNIVDKHVKQVFVTSHSPSLVASVKLDELCCLHRLVDGTVKVYSPKKVFATDEPAKKFIQRYLDATRADMLFAGGIIFVEGVAEQVLLPVFARVLGLYDKWLKKHVIVINISGRYFDKFLKLYDSSNPEALGLKVACITDRDPVRKEKGKTNARFESCMPSDYNADSTKYEYRNHSESLVEEYKDHPNIRYFSQGADSCTLEYEIALNNPKNKVLLVPSIKNSEELNGLIDTEGVDKALVASRYLESISKGVNALELSNAIMDLSESDREKFNVPPYIKEAIEWVLS
jgi:putative ATP-dependent endonuclease of OLD family